MSACSCAACSSSQQNPGKRQAAQRAAACMHKTDGKLFCVAAPIPGAGAGEGGVDQMLPKNKVRVGGEIKQCSVRQQSNTKAVMVMMVKEL